ncbi:hypothetical protein VNO78_06448 [Psophocarpus tetragonolobus]|uniref:E2 ubiquitin-conjugating enzyme n=1 Tax=Psophocarpus tetragonolobus TaxID=3891 RepID=A0AAN9XRV4_PSOTE
MQQKTLPQGNPQGMSSDENSSHDSDVIEIPPPSTMNDAVAADSMNNTNAILHDPISVDNSDNSAQYTLVGVQTPNDKGKAIVTTDDDGESAHQTTEVFDDSVDKSGVFNEHGSGGYDDDDENDYSEMFSSYDFMEIDQYTLIQNKFDRIDIPSGIEVPIPWLAHYNLAGEKNTTNSSHLGQSSHSSSTLEPTNRKTQALEMVTESCKTFDVKPKILYPPANNDGFVNFEDFKRPGCGSFKKSMLTPPGNNTSFHSNFVGPYLRHPAPGINSSPYPSIFVGSTAVLQPKEGDIWSTSTLNEFQQSFPNISPENISSVQVRAFVPFRPPHPPVHSFRPICIPNHMEEGNNEAASNSAVIPSISAEEKEEILKKFQSFKQFDIIQDTSDHHYVNASTSMKLHPKDWAKRIQEEWKSLEKDLPDSIFVRVYESRIDLLRAVIIGAEGTPYHDGLFFFDVSFPSDYPNVPPHVHYDSRGLRVNPNLYNCGKVCLSLLNTWSGNDCDRWIPGTSTILQVLVSIQGLILNSKPYFNEPGSALLKGTSDAEIRSLHFNEEVFILSLKTMVNNIKSPPKNFKDFVVGYFNTRAHDILVACKSYKDGAQGGCLVKGGVQDVDAGDTSCTVKFKKSLDSHLEILITLFIKIGAKDECEKVFPSIKATNPSIEVPGDAAVSGSNNV